MVALYAELDEKADHLRRADELKSRFLSNMTHEFRTPVNSILGLSNLLLDDRQRAGREPEPEVIYIRKAAEQLSELVNDLLDLAKVEAGKTVVRPAEFEVENLFGALRGMLRPLLLNQSVSLVFEDAAALPPMYSDEGKVSQILRNLHLERAEVHRARRSAGRPRRATDAELDRLHGRGHRHRHRAGAIRRGSSRSSRSSNTGCRRRCGAPGSACRCRAGSPNCSAARSRVDERARRRLDVHAAASPALHVAPRRPGDEFAWEPEPGKLPLLVVEDAPDAQYFYEKVLRSSAYQIYPAYTIARRGDRARS